MFVRWRLLSVFSMACLAAWLWDGLAIRPTALSCDIGNPSYIVARGAGLPRPASHQALQRQGPHRLLHLAQRHRATRTRTAGLYGRGRDDPRLRRGSGLPRHREGIQGISPRRGVQVGQEDRRLEVRAQLRRAAARHRPGRRRGRRLDDVPGVPARPGLRGGPDRHPRQGRRAARSFPPRSPARPKSPPTARPAGRRGASRRSTRASQFWWSKHEPFFKELLDTRGKEDVASPLGQWTKVECICAGDRVTIKINGIAVNECFHTYPSAGRILLQNEGNEIYFRNVELRPLKQGARD